MHRPSWHSILPVGRLLARCGLMFGLLGWVSLWAEVSRDSDVKAVFLYNFATFVDWPAAAFGTSTSPYVIGVLGSDPFGAAIDEIVTDERVKGRYLVVRRFSRVEDVHECQILFISASEAWHVADILHRLKGMPVLTVADIPGFTELGGAIGFTTGGRIKLIVNPWALRNANLTMSSKLLRLAQLSKHGGEAP